MGGINKVMLVGTLSKQPEVKHLQNGTTMVSFSVRTDEEWLDREGQQKSRPQFTLCVCWGKTGDFAATMNEGEAIAIEGRISTRSYDKDGAKQWMTEVNCSSATPLGAVSTEDYSNQGSADSNLPF